MQTYNTEKCLTRAEALKAMGDFLEKYYERTSSDDVGSLLGDIQILQDGMTADPAAWEDWCEKREKSYDGIQNSLKHPLTSRHVI